MKDGIIIKVLVLGGTGAMGMPLVNILVRRGHEVYVTSRSHHNSEQKNVHFILGNAHDMKFVQETLKERYKVVVDFMNYSISEFTERFQMLLNSTDHYVYLSSARVYSNSERAITESTSRLLDNIHDKKYLNTDEYALTKAREEDLLFNSPLKNWTIVRPYITYNSNRLQLGVLEKEYWLQRALKGKKIVFSYDIAKRNTTLTLGNDVALRIATLAEHDDSKGNVYQITTNQSIKWEEVLQVYLDTLEELTGKRPEVVMVDNADLVSKLLGNYYQIHYDRLYDRKFDSNKIRELSSTFSNYTDVQLGLYKSLTNFINTRQKFDFINWKFEAHLDRLTGDKTKIREISGFKQKINYLRYRYFI